MIELEQKCTQFTLIVQVYKIQTRNQNNRPVGGESILNA